ncbi:hypothetical protein IQ07DRAFT_363750 [Pyrenochaeta sp. DS3sAY3a]|nr:hypothetical protein IQ07DRAFT_363750 [Pyrenochaeta sp. DS3sAY3a]
MEMGMCLSVQTDDYDMSFQGWAACLLACLVVGWYDDGSKEYNGFAMVWSSQGLALRCWIASVLGIRGNGTGVCQ